MKRRCAVGLLMVTIGWLGCATTSFVSTWKSEKATPLNAKGKKVAALVILEEEAARRGAEDALAREITARGAVGVPMYTLVPVVVRERSDEVRAVLQREQVLGVVVMRPVKVERETATIPVTDGDPGSSTLSGAINNWSLNNSRADTSTTTTVSVDTLIYSVEQDQLVWSGRSKTTNPASINALVGELTQATAEELAEVGLIAR